MGTIGTISYMVKSVAEHSKKQKSPYFCNIPGVGAIPGLGEPHSVPQSLGFQLQKMCHLEK